MRSRAQYGGPGVVAFFTRPTSLQAYMHGRGARRLRAVLGFAVSNRVSERCSVTVATSDFISGMCGAPETTRSCRSNAASVPNNVKLLQTRTTKGHLVRLNSRARHDPRL